MAASHNSGKPTAEEWNGWKSRFTAYGVDPNDVERVLARIGDWDHWFEEWCRLGEMHETIGDEALAAGRMVTAADALYRACIAYHFAQFMWDHKPDEKEAGARKKIAVFQKAAPYQRPPVEIVEIPFEGTKIPGYLRLGANEPGPCAILLPGADSSKEQQFMMEGAFLARGISTLSIDGPGQGIYRYVMPLRLDYEKAVMATVDWLEQCGKVDPSRIALFGNSLGGHFAIRTAAFEARLKAAVCLGGRYDLAGWENRSALSKDSQTFLFGKTNWEEAAEFARRITLEGLTERVRCPVLIVHGGKDKISPVADARRIAEEVPDATLVVMEEGNHSCNNMPYRYRSLISDWVKEALA